MIKPGDKVSLFDAIGQVGLVLEVYRKAPTKKTPWMPSGTMMKKAYALVKFDSHEKPMQVPVERLMIV